MLDIPIPQPSRDKREGANEVFPDWEEDLRFVAHRIERDGVPMRGSNGTRFSQTMSSLRKIVGLCAVRKERGVNCR
jgi:hypothetical protein